MLRMSRTFIKFAKLPCIDWQCPRLVLSNNKKSQLPRWPSYNSVIIWQTWRCTLGMKVHEALAHPVLFGSVSKLFLPLFPNKLFGFTLSSPEQSERGENIWIPTAWLNSPKGLPNVCSELTHPPYLPSSSQTLQVSKAMN